MSAEQPAASPEEPPPLTAAPALSRVRLAAWILTGLALIAVLVLHLLPVLLTAMLIYELVHLIVPLLARRVSDQRAKVVAVTALIILIAAMIVGIALGALLFLRGDAGNLPALLGKMADVLDNARTMLPAWLAGEMPSGPDDVRDTVAAWLRTHAQELRLVSVDVLRVLAHVVIGLIVGAMIALHEVLPSHVHAPLAAALLERAGRLANAFHRVVFAQFRISLINTAFTAVYLFAVLPAFGITLPFRKTLVIVTLITGLLPVVGNLLSNTAIVLVSASQSGAIAVASLAFLVVIHKLEYFLNAKIVGSRIHAHPWELILVMVLMEAAFGIGGLAAAPIYYAYLKAELAERGLV
jgi:predicted PurR-regulated permease PerM